MTKHMLILKQPISKNLFNHRFSDELNANYHNKCGYVCKQQFIFISEKTVLSTLFESLSRSISNELKKSGSDEIVIK